MKTGRVRRKNWDAVRCVARDCEMVVGVSAGPRILCLRRGLGPNLLSQDIGAQAGCISTASIVRHAA